MEETIVPKREINNEENDEVGRRTIVEIVDVENGECLDANEVLEQDESVLIGQRAALNMSATSGKHKYVCAVCGQPLMLKCKTSTSFWFYSHLPNSGDCPIKASSEQIDPLELANSWLKRFRESQLHKDLTVTLTTLLERQEDVSEVRDRQSYRDDERELYDRRPDVSAVYREQQLVFEFQIFNTFITRILERNSFYRLTEGNLIWIQPWFTVEEQKMQEKDIFYTQKRNVFVFDSASYYSDGSNYFGKRPSVPDIPGYCYAQEESKKLGKVMLNCYWQVPLVNGEDVDIEWHHKLVSLDELSFDEETGAAYYHDSNKDFNDVFDQKTKDALLKWETVKKERWNHIFKRIHKRVEEAKERRLHPDSKFKRQLLEQVFRGEKTVTPFRENGLWGMKIDDSIIVEPKYQECTPFRQGLVYVRMGKGKWRAIDAAGKKQIDAKYTALKYLGGDRLAVTLDEESWYIMDFLENRLTDGSYKNIKLLPDGHYLCTEDWLKWIILDPQLNPGKYIEASKVEPIKGLTYLLVTDSDGEVSRYGLVDYRGNEIAPSMFTSINLDEDFIVFKRRGETRLPIMDMTTVRCTSLGHGICKLEKFGLLGLGLEDGSVILEPQFDYMADDIDDGTIKVGRFGFVKNTATNLRFGLLDLSGNVILKCDYDDISEYDNGVATVTMSGSQAKINNRGEFVNLDFLPIGGGFFKALVFNRFALFNAEYKRRSPSVYDDLEYLGQGLIKVKEGRDFGICDSKGCLVLNIIFKNIIPLTDHVWSLESFFREFIIFNPSTRHVDTYPRYKNLWVRGDRILFRKWKNWGMMDDKGNVLVYDNYTSLTVLPDGNVLCEKSRKYGQLDHNGHEIYPCINGQYELDDKGNLKVEELVFTEELGSSRKFGMVALMGKDGIPLTGYVYNDIQLLRNNTLLATQGENHGCLDSSGKEIIPLIYQDIRQLKNGNFLVKKDNKFGLLDKRGTILEVCEHDVLEIDEYGNILVEVIPLTNGFNKVKKYGRYALQSADGSMATEYHYDDIEVFNGQLFLCRIKSSRGIIDTTGKTIIPCEYGEVSILPNGNFLVKREPFYGLFGHDGTVLANCLFDHIDLDEDGNPKEYVTPLPHWGNKVKRLNYYAISDTEGKRLSDFIYEDIMDCNGHVFVVPHNFWICELIDLCTSATVETFRQFEFIEIQRNGNLLVKVGGRWGLYSPDGSVLEECIHSELPLDENGDILLTEVPLGNGFKKVERLGKYALYSDSGRLSDYIFDDITQVDEDRFIVMRWNSRGVIDSNGGVIINMVYNAIRLIGGRWFQVVLDSQTGLFDRDGNTVLPCEYSKLTLDENKNPIVEYTMLAPSYGKAYWMCKYALCNADKAFLTPFIYNEIEVFDESVALVRIKINNSIYSKMWKGLVDCHGKTLVECRYSDIRKGHSGDFIVTNDSQKSVVKSDGQIIPLPRDYCDFFALSDGNFCVRNLLGKYGIVSLDGKVILPCCSKEILSDDWTRLIEINELKGNMYKGFLMGKYAIYDGSKRRVTGFIYDKVLFSRSGQVLVAQRETCGVIGPNGIIIPCRYKRVDFASQNTFIVRESRSFGLLNDEGKIILPLKYSGIKDCGDGKFSLLRNKKKEDGTIEQTKEIFNYRKEVEYVPFVVGDEYEGVIIKILPGGLLVKGSGRDKGKISLNSLRRSNLDIKNFKEGAVIKVKVTFIQPDGKANLKYIG